MTDKWPCPVAPLPTSESFTMKGYTYAEAIAREIVAPYPVVKGVIDKGDVSFWYGDSGTMKSFIVADLMFHAATGKDWHQFKVREPCGVLVVLGEGQAGYIKRLKGLHYKHGIADAPIYVWPESIALDTEADILATAIDETEKLLGISVQMIVMDTFSLMLGGMEESSNRDVSIAVRNVRQAADGRAVAFIHHTGHGDKGRERGAYQIRANADTRVLVTRDEEGKGQVLTVACEKRKDGEVFEPFNLSYEVVKVGIDEDGDDITTCVIVTTDLEPVINGPAKRNKPGDYLTTAIQITGSNQREIVRKQFLALYPGEHEAKKRAFNRAWREYMQEATSHA